VAEWALTYYKIWFWLGQGTLEMFLPMLGMVLQLLPLATGYVSSIPDIDCPNGFLSKNGTPVAYFPNTNCDFGAFEDHNIIINLTLCMWPFSTCDFSRSAGFW